MLNYIWAGLIISSLVFAVVSDVRDAANNRYRNDARLPVTLVYAQGYQSGERSVPVAVRINPQEYQAFYGVDAAPDSMYYGSVIRTQRGTQLRFASSSSLPDPLTRIRAFSASADDELQGTIEEEVFQNDSTLTATSVQFSAVRFPRLQDITGAAFNFAETAAELALGLIGILCLFLGLLQIADASGLITSLVRFTEPLLRPLFPEIPKGHPAFGMIVLNLSANVLGLGNAATPLGIKAMEELQDLNPTKETATNSMVMLLAMNTASVQLVPPALLVAVMGLQVNELILPIILVTGFSLLVGVSTTRLLQRLPTFKRDDPALIGSNESNAPGNDVSDTRSSSSSDRETP